MSFFTENYNTIIVLAGASLLGAASGMIGCFAVLRRRALVGDALAHAALPGLALAFMATGSTFLPTLLAGALITGVAGVALIGALRRWTRVKEDAAIGVVLGVFFGAGIALTTYLQHSPGGGSQIGVEAFILGKTAGMLQTDVYLFAAVAGVALLTVAILYKEFALIVFDAEFAGAQGWPVLLLDLLLMALVALAVAIGLPAVGVVMIAALLILPGAAARFWTDSLPRMLVLSALFGTSVAVVGTLASAHFDLLPAGPVIVLSGATFFILSMLFAPRRGLVSRASQERSFRRQMAERKLLVALYEQTEAGDDAASRDWIVARYSSSAINAARRAGYLNAKSDHAIRLASAGRRRAIEAVRGKRLWEAFLTESPESAVALADLSIESAAELVPPDMASMLIERLQLEGRWPQFDESTGDDDA